MLPQGYDSFAFISQSPLPWWTLLIAGAMIAVVTVMSVAAYWRAGRRYLWLAVLHTLAACLLLALVMQPAVDLRATTRIPGRVAVVIDDSQSMAEKDGFDKTRAERVQAALADKLQDVKGVEFYTLNGPGRSGQPQGASSDLLKAIEGPLESHHRARPVSAVVLVSDGADTEGFGRAKDPERELERFKRFSIPVNTISVAGAKTADIFIQDVVQDPIAFVRNTVKVEATIGSKGYGRLTVPVSLKRDGALITQKTAEVDDGKVARVQFEFVPDQVGESVFTVEVPPQAEEAVLANNRRDFIIKVVRDKIRVLLVTGRPSWDERFLRRALKMSPNVDLISFFILRTPGDQPGSQSEMSLIPFPTNELFNTELHTFDVVILQNFDYRPYNMSYLLTNLRDHVMKGGAIVMLGGELSFGGGAYGQTPLSEVLPVNVSDGDMDVREFVPVLTPAGEKHPVLRLGAGNLQRAKLLQKLPKIAGTMKVDGLAPGATALLTHPDLKGRDGQPMPVIAVREVGRGRTMAITTDSLWRWSFTEKLHGETGAVYDRLLGQVFRWLMRDPEASRVRLTASRDRVKVGETVDYAVRVLGPDYLPMAGAPVVLTVKEQGRAETQVSGATAEDGVYGFSYTVASGGVVRATAEVRTDEDPLDATLLVYGDDADQEHAALAPRDDLMQLLAQKLGGTHQTLENIDPRRWTQAEAEVVNVDRHREIPLWNTWVALAAIVVVLGLEWLLRRRWGFV